MLELILETVSQYLFVVLFSPLLIGIFEKLKANIESRKGPSIFQPYYDIFKLFKKETLITEGSSKLFLYAPYMAFGIYSLIALIIPVFMTEPIIFTASGDFFAGAILFSLAAFIKIIGTMDSGSNFSAMGASRLMSFNFFSEGTLITVFFAVALITGTNNPYTTNHYLISHPLSNLSLVHIFAIFAFFMIFMYEFGKMPTQSEGNQEMGMIDSGIDYEYSGKALAVNKWSSYIKVYLLGSVLINVFLIPWGMFNTFPLFFLNALTMIAKWLFLIIIVLIVDTSMAKLRLFKVIDYLAVAFTFSILFLILSEVIA
ncbi:MAG: respiratory chain complex I subunit 1 family protein [Ferroplasma sp.]|uniref:respiratory chain complex I subunit 1 family protein n=1 Tax=Ferroplasma sp. TaxID=2591003 RepID=UPI002815735D|nr:respiratory chain complex I subunit 1 family protein [Ferroplasma sp.]WMT52115.1 MAG: respiratory chain complex I subunit 1 family protein [Ferroplasma sp.]